MDGVDLHRFQVGETYEVGNALASVFLAEEWAIPVESDDPAVVTPLSELMINEMRRLREPSNVTDSRSRFPLYHGVRDVAEAADSSRKETSSEVMTQTRIIRRCPSCRSENIVLFHGKTEVSPRCTVVNAM